MSTLKFQTKSIDGKPVICFEQDVCKSPEKRKFDYKSRNQKFILREPTDSQSIRGNDSYRGSECDSTSIRPDWNSPVKSRQRQTLRKRSESLERDSRYNGGRQRPRNLSNDEETVTLTKSQLAQLLSQTGVNHSGLKTGSRINYADEEERRLALPFDDYEEEESMSLSEELARKRQNLAQKKFNSSQAHGRPPVPSSQNRKPTNSRAADEEPYNQSTRHKRPPAENVMGLIAKLQEEQKQAGKRKPPPPIGGFRGKDQRMFQKKQAAGSDDDDELGMNNRKPKFTSKQNKSRDRPSSQQYFNDDEDDERLPSRGRRHQSNYVDGDLSDEQRDERRGERSNAESGDDARIDAVMQRVIEENRGKLSEEDLVELLSQVYIELKKGKMPENEKEEIRTNVKNSDHHETNGNHQPPVANKADKTLQTSAKSSSLMEKKKLQWEREREEMASLPGNAPWNSPVVQVNDSHRRTNSRSSSQQQSTHFTNSSASAAATDSGRPTYGRVSQLHQEALMPRGPTGDENTAMSFGSTLNEARKKEADRRAWIDGLNQQRLDQRTSSHQEKERKRSIDAPNNASNINDRPF